MLYNDKTSRFHQNATIFEKLLMSVGNVDIILKIQKVSRITDFYGF